MAAYPDTERAQFNLRAALQKLHEAEEQVPVYREQSLDRWRVDLVQQRVLLQHVDALITAALQAIGGKL